MKTAKHFSSGFTMVELSIVVIVIGLVFGGIMVGRDLIRSAHVRAQVAQIEQINTAVSTFENRFDCLPGDCNHAVKVGLGTDAGPGDDGDGNTILDADITGGASYNLSTAELANFWYHLMQAKLLSGVYPGYIGDDVRPGIDTPPLKLEGTGMDYPTGAPKPTVYWKGGFCVVYPPQLINSEGTAIFDPNRGHALILANRCDIYPNVIYKATEAFDIDSKIDDGLPYQGGVRGYMYGLYAWTMDLSYFGIYACISDNAYNLRSADLPLTGVVYEGLPSDVLTLGKQCGLIVQASF